jgi:hypothetical protein
VTAQPADVDLGAPFVRTRRPVWLTPALLGLATFALTSLSIRSAAERQEPILDSMEIQPFEAAATLAYAWGSLDDARALERQVLALAERRRGTESASHPPARSSGDPDFATLRRMDADMAKFRLAVLEDAPRPTFDRLCAAATIRCNVYTLDGLINILKKQRLVPDKH